MDCMIWTPVTVRYQSYTKYGEVRLSDLGPLSLTSCQNFCQQHGIRLYVQDRKPKALWSDALSPIAKEELAARGY